MESYLAKGGWNLAVRTAQEVVELALKAYIALAGLEYPKTHDPGPAFADAVREWGGPPDEVVREILTLSEWLAAERGPVFYAEKVSTEAEARRAVEGARMVLAVVDRWLAR